MNRPFLLLTAFLRRVFKDFIQRLREAIASPHVKTEVTWCVCLCKAGGDREVRSCVFTEDTGLLFGELLLVGMSICLSLMLPLFLNKSNAPVLQKRETIKEVAASYFAIHKLPISQHMPCTHPSA